MDKTFSRDEFNAAYAALNSSQKQAVDAIEGPVMVIAGPGTGKTQVLTLRIANILLQTDTAPESILALTFTKAGARAMRERLRRFVGATAYRIPIYTFHGFCEHLISEYPEQYERIVGSQPITDIEKISFLETILESPEARLFRPVNAPEYYIAPLQSIISTMKQENVSPDVLANIINQEENLLSEIEQYHTKGAHKGKERSEYKKTLEKIEKQRTLLFVYRQYEALLQSERRYDFDDMILETVRALSSVESVLQDIQEQFQYVLADEHQDVNGAQNEILSLITSYHDNPNLFVVGDEKQSIYRFQGASLENFLYFETQYPSTKVISMLDNYRSAQNILDCSHELIKVTDGPLKDYRVALKAKGVLASGVIKVERYAHELFEHEALVREVGNLIKAGTEASEIAVIVRSNREVESITTLLRDVGIAVSPSADGDILTHPVFRAVLDLLTAIAEPWNDTALGAVLQASYTGLSIADVATIMRQVNYQTPLSKLLFDESKRSQLDLVEAEKLTIFVTNLQELQKIQVTEAPHRVLASALERMKLLEQVAVVDIQGSTRVIRRLYDEVETLVTNKVVDSMSALVTQLKQRVAYQIPLQAPYIPDGSSAVQVMTAHKSKGLEFEVVFIPHLSDSSWSGKKRKDLFKVPLTRTADLVSEANEDERRLLYVAMTRAKNRLVMSYASLASDGKEMTASPFLYEINALVPETVVPETSLEACFTVHKPLSPQAIVPLLEHNFNKRGLSVTALNNLIDNPWNYFFRNVIRLPEVQTAPLQFGTAMHGVMEYMTSYHTTHGQLPAFSDVRQRLEYALGRLPLSVTEFTSLFEKGQVCIPAHLDFLQQTLPKTTREEFSVRVELEKIHPAIPTLALNGKLDRIDLSDSGQATRVIDYKTGKPKSA